MDWETMMDGQVFITDLGENQLSVVNEQETVLGRYAVWSPVKGQKGHQIVEVSEALDYLLEKYHIPQDKVCVLLKESV